MLSKLSLTLAFNFFTYMFVFAQWQAAHEWAMRYDGPASGVDLLSTLTLDHVGNVYVTGRSSGSGTGQDFATLKYSPGGQSLLELRYNQSGTSWDEPFDIFVDDAGNVYVAGVSSARGITTVKYDAFGDTLWTANLNASGGAEGLCLAVDSLFNVYVGGNVWNAGPGADIAVIKYSPSGVEQWSTFLRGDSSYDNGLIDLEVDGQGSVFITAKTANQFFDEFFYNDFITVKLDTAGIEEWRQYYSASNTSDDIPIGLEIDQQGNVIIGGNSFEGDDDYVTIKYTPIGVQEWIRTYESPSASEDIAMSMAVDSEDNIIITGYSWRDSEAFNYLTVKYDSSGNKLWVSEYIGEGNKRDFAHAVALDAQDDIYVTGSSREGTLGDAAAHTVRYNPNGDQVWAISYCDTASSSNFGHAIAVDPENNVYVGIHSFGNNSGWDYVTVKYRQDILGLPGNNNLPGSYHLFQNYPNPFNPLTTIAYELPVASEVELTVFDLLGRKVRMPVNAWQPAGNHKIVFEGAGLSSGIYYYQMKIDGEAVMTRKMVLLK